MPPEKKLSRRQIDDLTRWVKIGAPWPNAKKDAAVALDEVFEITEEDRSWWSFQPISRPDTPRLAGARQEGNPIDAFIRARLLAAALMPSPEASSWCEHGIADWSTCSEV